MQEARSTKIVRGTFDGGLWETAIRQPDPALRSYVLSLVGYDERSPEPSRMRQFPASFVVLIIELGPSLSVSHGRDGRPTRHRGGFVAGLGGEYAITEHDGRQTGIQIDLTPTGARRLFGMPLSEIAGSVLTLQDVDPKGYRDLVQRIGNAASWEERLDQVEAFLGRRILGTEIETSRVDWALGRIGATSGTLDVGSLALELGHSHKHLISLFRDQVGIPPKLFARLVRFKSVIECAQSTAPVRWVDLAIDFGFSDQAHLAREIRHFSGLTPTEARANHTELSEILR